MRVLYVTPLYEPACIGGIVRSTSELCRSLALMGHRVTVFTTDSDGHAHMDVPVNRAVDVGGVEVHYFSTETPRLFRYSKSLKEACSSRMGEFDIAHIVSFWNYPGIPAARAAHLAGVPYMVSPRGTFIPKALSAKSFRKWLYLKMFDERILRGAAAYHYTSSLERRNMQDFKVQRPSVLIPNGVDLADFEDHPSRTEARGIIGLSEGDFVVGFLGRLHWIKALDVLIAAVDRLIAARRTSICVLLAGPDDGAERQLRQLVEERGLAEHVRFLGVVQGRQKAQVLSALDVLALVSWTENFGNAAAEAMAMGVPVLVSEKAGICDTVQKGMAGIVVPVEERAIAEALIDLMDHEERREAMGRAAREVAWARFARDHVGAIMATAYRDILDGTRSPECDWA